MEVMFGKVKDATGVAESHVSVSGLYQASKGSSLLKGVLSCLFQLPLPPAELSTLALSSFPSSPELTSLGCQFWVLYLSGSVSQTITVWTVEWSRIQ